MWTPSPAADGARRGVASRVQARLRGYVPVQAGVLESAVRRDDGRRTSWLALLDGFALLVLHERAGWQMPNARDWRDCWCDWAAPTRPGPSCWTSCGTAGLGRAAHILDALPAEELAACALGVARMLFAAVAARPRDCRVGRRTARRRLSRASPHGSACAPTSRPCTNGPRPLRRPTRQIPRREVDPAGILEKARALVARGRTASAQRHVQRAAWACARRNAHRGVRPAAGGGLAAGRGARRPAAVAAQVARGGPAGAGRTRDLPDRGRRGCGRAVDSPGGAGRRRVPLALGAGRLARARCASTAAAGRAAGDVPVLAGPLGRRVAAGRRRQRATGSAASRSRASGRGSSSAMRPAPWPTCTQRWRQAGRRRGDRAAADRRRQRRGRRAQVVSRTRTRGAPRPRLSLADDDQVLVPAEGLVRRHVALPESLVRRLRALTRHDVRAAGPRARAARPRAGLGARGRSAADRRRGGARRARHQRPGAAGRAGPGVGLAGAL